MLEPGKIGLRYVLARISTDLKAAWPGWKSRRVRGELNGVPLYTTVFPVAGSKGCVLVVNRAMQKAARVAVGSRVELWLEPDMAEAAVAIPAELERALKEARGLRRWFDALSPAMRKGLSQYVDAAKGAETREKRAGAMAECVMQAMEGEKSPPPVLRAAFERQPETKLGWEAMTPIQRRTHLMGIFYAQTVAGREKRVAWTVEECLRVARRKK